jgi:mRNA interferase HicA
MKVKQFIQRLRRAGVEIVEGRGKGGHVLAKYKDKQTTIPAHGMLILEMSFLRRFASS